MLHRFFTLRPRCALREINRVVHFALNALVLDPRFVALRGNARFAGLGKSKGMR